jgi:hypothetical protein
MKKRVTPPGEPVPDKPLWQSNVPLPDVSGVRAWPGLAWPGAPALHHQLHQLRGGLPLPRPAGCNLTAAPLPGCNPQGCNAYLPNGQTLERYLWTVKHLVAAGQRARL